MKQQNRPRFIVECTGSRSEDGRLIWNGRMLDLSVPGWSRTGLKGLQAGDMLQLHLHIPGQPKPLSVRFATIRWASESRLGVDPILMDADDQLRLHAFVSGHGTVPHFNTDRKEQIVISDAG
jgi:PilZ domain.